MWLDFYILQHNGRGEKRFTISIANNVWQNIIYTLTFPMTLVGCCCCTITCCPPSELVGMRVGRICFPDCCCCNCTPLEGVVFTRLGGPAVVVISVVPPSPCMLPTLLIGICWYISPPMLRSITPFWVSMMVLFFPDVGDTFRADTPLVPTAAVGCIRT